MKFAVAVVVLALAAGIESHAVPWEVPVEGSYVAKTQGAVHVAPLSGHANSAAAINLQPAPGTVSEHDLEGEYVAKTQGAVHIAPLAGHAKSVIADNDHAAPGTTHGWIAPAAVPLAYPSYGLVAPVPVAPAAHAAEGEYVAKTQGAVHVAPLAGHAKSVASINDESAPGTSHGWTVPASVPAYGPVAVPAYGPVAVPAYVPAVAQASIVAHPPVAAHATPLGTAEGEYVAKTLGAVHVAPLAGHAHSAASINLQPAPGTIY